MQIVCADAGLLHEYLRELESVAEPCALLIATVPFETHHAKATAVILFDESAIQSADAEAPFESAVALLFAAAPVVVVAAPERQSDLTFLITSGAVDFVARSGNFVPIAAGLVERRLRLLAAASRAERLEPAADFGEILRHEVNNPLTGILGNAEMLLARRDRLPPSAIERLETIAELAIRLRETVRRLSNGWE